MSFNEVKQGLEIAVVNSAMLQSDSGLQHSSSLHSGLLRASSGVAEGMRSAIERTSSMKSAISRSSSAGAKDLLAALQSTANGDLEEATEQARSFAS